MTVRISDIPSTGSILTMSSPSFFMEKPKQRIYSPIPEDVRLKMRPAHSTEYFEARNVQFHLVQNVYIAAEGLIFDENGEVYSETITQHSRIEIEAASQAISAARTQNALKRISGAPCVLCVKRGTANYGHWLVEMLPKAFLAKKVIAQTALRFVVPDARGQLASVIEETLHLLGIEENDVIRVDQNVVFCERLIVISGLTDHGTYMSPLVMDCMETLGKRCGAGAQTKIFVVRPAGSSRHFENEDQLRTFLQWSGFHLVDTSLLSFSEQVAVFKGARRVVGTMGAAMTNIAFCRPGTAITTFAPGNMPDTFYWFLSGLRHLSYEEVRCAPAGPVRGLSPWDTDLILPREYLSDLLA